MKLTKDQRYTAYCIMMEEFMSDVDCPSFCFLITNTLEWFSAYFDEKTFDTMLPELYKFKNVSKYSNWWFKDRKERIVALKQCIKETENF